MSRLISIISIIIIFLSLANCRKSEDDMSKPQSSVNKNEIILDSIMGYFVAWKQYDLDYSKDYPFTNTYEYNSIFATFYDSPFPNGNPGQNVGNVFCDGTMLIPTEDSSYIPGYYADSIINLSNNITYDVQGNEVITGFRFKDPIGFPYMSEIVSEDTLKRNADFIITFDTISNVDSINYYFSGVGVVTSGDITSFTIKKEQLSLPEWSDNSIQYREIMVRAYSHSIHSINGKKFYFRNIISKYKAVVLLGK